LCKDRKNTLKINRFKESKNDTKLLAFTHSCAGKVDRGGMQSGLLVTTPAGEPSLNYLCEGWKSFFHHIDFHMQIIAGLIRRGYPASEDMREGTL
jgi:uncharacterized protein